MPLVCAVHTVPSHFRITPFAPTAQAWLASVKTLRAQMTAAPPLARAVHAVPFHRMYPVAYLTQMLPALVPKMPDRLAVLLLVCAVHCRAVPIRNRFRYTDGPDVLASGSHREQVFNVGVLWRHPACAIPLDDGAVIADRPPRCLRRCPDQYIAVSLRQRISPAEPIDGTDAARSIPTRQHVVSVFCPITMQRR